MTTVTKVNAALFKFRSLQGSVYRVQFLAGQDRAVEKQEYVWNFVAVDVVGNKKAPLGALLIWHQYIPSL